MMDSEEADEYLFELLEKERMKRIGWNKPGGIERSRSGPRWVSCTTPM